MKEVSKEIPSPGCIDSTPMATNLGIDLDSPLNTSEKLTEHQGAKSIKNLRVLHVQDLPGQCDYETILSSFGSFGAIMEIRMNFLDVELKWEAWITFCKYEDALKACSSIHTIQVNGVMVIGALTDKAPKNLDVYKPSEWAQDAQTSHNGNAPVRTPKPPMWLIAYVKEENYNYYKCCRYLQRKVGGIKSGDVSRFGKGTVLIHAKSKTQAQMLSLMKFNEADILKEIRPHWTFSYGRGVIFDKDLYEFSENEILEMSPPSVWKVKKASCPNMIILTFEDSNVPPHVFFENERIKVRPFQNKPIQCFNCFRFGHSSKVCKNAKTCLNCSALEHGICEKTPKCSNCQLDHQANDKNCNVFKFEQSAVNKSNSEHISIGYARRALGKSKTYAQVLTPKPLSTTKGPVVAPPAAGASPPVVEAQPPGSGAQPEAGAQPSSRGNLSTTKGPVVAPPAAGASPPVVEAQPPGSGVQPEAGAQPSSRGKVALEKNRSSSKERLSASSTPNLLSQAESLPELMVTEHPKLQKRGRSPSSSPPTSPNKSLTLHNRYEVLDAKGKMLPDKNTNKLSGSKSNLPRPVIKKPSLDNEGNNKRPEEKTPSLKRSSKNKK